MPIEPTSRRSRIRMPLWLALAMALAAALQLAAVVRSEVIAKDGIRFLSMAREFAADPVGLCARERQHPGYPAIVLVAASLLRTVFPSGQFDEWLVGARLISCGAGLGCVAFTWLLSRRIMNEQVANVAALLHATLPIFRLNAADVLSDTPHLMLYLCGAWLACEGIVRGRAAWFAAAGLAGGAAYSIRPEGLAISAVAGAALALMALRPTRLPFFSRQQPAAAPSAVWPSRPLLCFAALVLMTAAPVLPYVAATGKLTRKKEPFGPPPPTEAVVAAAGGPTEGLLAEPVDGRDLSGETRRPAWLWGAIGAALVEFCHEFGQASGYFLLVPLAFAVFDPRCTRPSGWRLFYVTSLMFCHLGLLVVLFVTAGYISHRHVMPFLALTIPGAACGILHVGNLLAAWRPGWRAAAWQRVLAGALVAWPIPLAIRPLHPEYLPLLQAARWVREHSQPGEGVLATSGYVRFYADRPGVLLGPEAANLKQGLALAPVGRKWPFVVLEVDVRRFDANALTGAAEPYEQVLELPSHPKRPWAKVLVFQARSPAASRLAHRPGG